MRPVDRPTRRGAVHGAFAIVIGAALACVCTTAAPASPEAGRVLPGTVTRALEAAEVPASAVGAFVQEIGAGAPVLAVNADRPMNPASVMKLVTTYAGLELLGPAHAWRTELLSAGQPQGGRLEADLYLKGGGDPKLTIERLWLLLRELRSQGVRDIRGDVVVDASALPLHPVDPAAFDGEPTRPYNVGPYGALVNFKAVELRFVPGTRAGDPVALSILPRIDTVTVSGEVRSTAGPCGDWRSALRLKVAEHGHAANLAVAGGIPAACGSRAMYVSVLSHAAYVQGAIRALWEEIGGTIEGGSREGVAPPNARVLAATESTHLAEVIRDINKFSNNVMARQLYLALPAGTRHEAGSDATAERAIHTWLASKRINPAAVVVENGSGLSRSERIGASTLGRLLLEAWQSPVMPEFVASMPVTAVDGTMRHRLARDPLAARAHVKTGSLRDVNAIGGYVHAPNGRRFVVVMLVNHPNANRSVPAQDALLRWTWDRASARCRPGAAGCGDG